MSRSLVAAALALMAIGTGTPAQACAVHEPLNLADARRADAVVIGRISAPRTASGNPPALHLTVDEVLAGRAARSLRIGVEPGLALPRPTMRGQVLIALRRSPTGLAVMQHICSDPFILDARSRQARLVRAMLPPRR
jgi:hypothetical protein